MDADDIVMCGSCIDKHMANMQDKMWNGNGYEMEIVAAILITGL